MALHEDIQERRAEIRSDGYPMSIGELVNLYRDGELNIHPEFQRFFRWTATQKARLIESLLLGIPLPSIFVSQRDDGVWDVVDGLQRLSTIFEFMGILKNEGDECVEPLVLVKTKYLPSLEKRTWRDDGTHQGIGSENQLIIKRSKIDVKMADALGDDSFRRYDHHRRRHLGRFLISAFEVVAMGLGFNVARQGYEIDRERVQTVARDIWRDGKFLTAIGSGVGTSSRIPVTIPRGRALFA